MKEPHIDRLGKEIAVGNCVVLPSGNHLRIGQVISLTPKMVRVKELNDLKWKPDWLKYPSDLVVVDGPGVTMLLLKASK